MLLSSPSKVRPENTGCRGSSLQSIDREHSVLVVVVYHIQSIGWGCGAGDVVVVVYSYCIHSN